MRKLLLFSSVAVLSFGAFVVQPGSLQATGQTPSGNQGAAPDSEIPTNETLSYPEFGVKVDAGLEPFFTGFTQDVGNYFSQHSNENRGSLQRLSEQYLTGQAIGTNADYAIGTAVSTNYAKTAQDSDRAQAMRGTAGSAERSCIVTTSKATVLKPLDKWIKFREEIMERRMAVINSQDPLTENGWLDMASQLSDQRNALCDPQGDGGADVNCTGSGNAQISVATILHEDNIPEDVRNEEVEYITNLLCARILPSSNPDLYENPSARKKILTIQKDVWKLKLSQCQATISDFIAMRTVPEDGGNFVPRLIEALQEGGDVSQEVIDKFAPNGRASLKGIMSLITYMRFNPNFDQQGVDKPELNLFEIKFNTAWTNFMLLQMNNNLEKISLALTTNAATEGFEYQQFLQNEILSQE